MTGTQELLAELRRGPVFRAVVAMESNLGWPIPQLREAGGRRGVYLTVPAFRTRPREAGGVYLLAPHARLTIGWPTGRVVAFTDHAFDCPWPVPVDGERPVGAFPHPGLPADTETYQQWRATAFAFYDELLAMMADARPIPQVWWGRFAAALGPVVEPGLLPFYRVLGPKFFARVVPEATDRVTPGARS